MPRFSTNIPREEIEAKLNLAKRELGFAGPIHSRDLRKHMIEYNGHDFLLSLCSCHL